MARVTKRKVKNQIGDDQDQLQALDESNTRWVKEWKRIIKKQKKTGS